MLNAINRGFCSPTLTHVLLREPTSVLLIAVDLDIIICVVVSEIVKN
uniref:Uncharacterized protein n=1 Tax=Arundo donax TaxID=35708 RepID=A0A0A9DU54_ARUDO